MKRRQPTGQVVLSARFQAKTAEQARSADGGRGAAASPKGAKVKISRSDALRVATLAGLDALLGKNL